MVVTSWRITTRQQHLLANTEWICSVHTIHTFHRNELASRHEGHGSQLSSEAAAEVQIHLLPGK